MITLRLKKEKKSNLPKVNFPPVFCCRPGSSPPDPPKMRFALATPPPPVPPPPVSEAEVEAEEDPTSSSPQSSSKVSDLRRRVRSWKLIETELCVTNMGFQKRNNYIFTDTSNFSI